MIEYSQIQPDNIEEIVTHHIAELNDEFLVQFGDDFLKVYYKAWISSPCSYNVVAKDGSQVVGAMLTAINPPLHYKYIARHHLVNLSVAALKSCLKNLSFLSQLIRTRGIYYAKGILKLIFKTMENRFNHVLKNKLSAKNTNENPIVADSKQKVQSDCYPHDKVEDNESKTSNFTNTNTERIDFKVAELAHIFVVSEFRNSGVAKTMIEMLKQKCINESVASIELVTPVESPSVGFYEKLGFYNHGKIVAKTKESFIKFKLDC